MVIVVDRDLCGGPIKAAVQQMVKVDNKLVVVLADQVTPHTPHTSPIFMIEGSEWMSIQGRPVCRTGDHATCGHQAIGSATWFDIP
jgi:uncharacterized Zn-binding protein involved in type VI secretion